MRFANLLVAAFVVLWPLAATEEIIMINGYWIKSALPRTGFEAVTRAVFDHETLQRTWSCSPERAPLILDAVSDACPTLNFLRSLREGERKDIIEGREIDLMGGLNEGDLTVLEERYFGKLTKEQQDSITSTLLTASDKLIGFNITFLCVEWCLPTQAAYVFRDFNNETIHLCPAMSYRGKSWWDVILARDAEERIESQEMSRSLTIVHEMMHLANRPFNGLTSDQLPELIVDITIDEHCSHPDMNYCKAYGRKAAQELAKQSPYLALRNADNYAFYVADVFLAYLEGMESLNHQQEQELAEDLPLVSTVPRTTEPEPVSASEDTGHSSIDPAEDDDGATTMHGDEPESTSARNSTAQSNATKGSLENSTDQTFGAGPDMVFLEPNATIANATKTVNATEPIANIFNSILEWFGFSNSTNLKTSEGPLEEEADVTSDDRETTRVD
ncbi:hypothetical protein HII31_00865 [Pseudocercospora fuligena]|uniref:Lysine-specific metallo-endopeptidase domain-containing protein n=1 Tax=Pseudocercospora fuligena TaxID=685502 RepID=A0A8H6RSU2_9PEZI|nr:hypothetical protein HII31_00865 [Pseudocercospora fuligena]